MVLHSRRKWLRIACLGSGTLRALGGGGTVLGGREGAPGMPARVFLHACLALVLCK